MAYAFTVEAVHRVKNVSPEFMKGQFWKILYSFTRGATDTTGTIDTALAQPGTIKTINVTGNIISKPLTADFSGTTITVSGDGTAGSTKGWMEVLVLDK